MSLLLIAALVRPATPDRDALAVGPFELPSVCGLRNLTGVPCPGCGMTRSAVAAMHADLPASLAHHRLGWLVVGYLVLQTIARGAALVSAGWRERGARVFTWLDRGVIVLAVLLALNWIPTLVAALG